MRSRAICVTSLPSGKPKAVAFPDPALWAVKGSEVAILPVFKLVEIKLGKPGNQAKQDVAKPIAVDVDGSGQHVLVIQVPQGFELSLVVGVNLRAGEEALAPRACGVGGGGTGFDPAF